MVLSGDIQKFRLISERYHQSVFNLVSRLLRDREKAGDVAQQTFLNAYRSLKTYDTSRSFAPWILRIAQNCALKELKKMGSVREVEMLDVDYPNEYSLTDKDRPTPSGVIERKFETSLLESVISELRDSFKTVIILRHQEHMKQKDIAITLNIPLSTVKSRLTYAYAYMQKRLASLGLDRP